ncbi:MAG: tRNA (N6-isopentenyl adenosine(37)-C2)-methylthiotransferase MiaB [Micrococcales bacterium]|nr:tRNA (N6-isopentenyl adenosine(37)-C2)-methylthiotransferase MiaB [Micrococcales bacterium]
MNAPTYAIRTLGCQMNLHDAERMAGLLEEAGYVPVPGQGGIRTQGIPEADVVVINTCAVRENAATRLYGNLGQLRELKKQRPGMRIAVGGCLAQHERNLIVDKAPWVDVVFGTHNLGSLPGLLEQAQATNRAQVEIAEELAVFPSALPARRESVYAAWVSISVGCNNTCTFCIVPQLRGRERDRRPAEIQREVEAAVAAGAIEVTLLGQNVNSYGAGFGDKGAFAKLLRRVGATDGLERLRFTSPHPAAFSEDVIEAMAAVPAVAPQLHLPLQSGSDRVLKAMRRSYRAARFLELVAGVRAAIPEAAISSDLIVGFPGETEADFRQTLEVVEAAQFASAYTFLFSPRPGTPAATMAGQMPTEVMTERFDRLVALQNRIAEVQSAKQVGRVVEVLVAEGEGRKDAATLRVSGRAFDGRLVHVSLPDAGSHPLDPRPGDIGLPDAASHPLHPRPGDIGLPDAASHPLHPRPGDIVRTVVTGSAPHHLLADAAPQGGLFEVSRTPAGDAWDRSQNPPIPRP